MIGLICATDEEFSQVFPHLGARVADQSAGMFKIVEGTLSGKAIVLSCSGTGKVGAASLTQLIIDRYSPEAIINFGTAGSLVNGLVIGDVIVPEKVFQGDVGVVHGGGFGSQSINVDKRLAFALEYTPNPSLFSTAQMVARDWVDSGKNSVYFNPVVTCDQIILSRDARQDLNKSFGAVAVEMESAAAAHVAANFGVPFLTVRSISDTLDSDLEGFQELYQYMGESRAARWWRRAKFSALHPKAISRVPKMIDGIGKASSNSANFICMILGEME